MKKVMVLFFVMFQAFTALAKKDSTPSPNVYFYSMPIDLFRPSGEKGICPDDSAVILSDIENHIDGRLQKGDELRPLINAVPVNQKWLKYRVILVVRKNPVFKHLEYACLKPL